MEAIRTLVKDFRQPYSRAYIPRGISMFPLADVRATFLFNLSRSIIALLVKRVVITTCLATNFSVASRKKLLQKVKLSFALCSMFLQLVTPKFVARQVEHAVVIRATTRSACNIAM